MSLEKQLSLLMLPLGWAACYAAFLLVRRSKWLGFWSTYLAAIVLAGIPIFFVPEALDDIASRLSRAVVLGATCGALCANLIKHEEREKRIDQRVQARLAALDE